VARVCEYAASRGKGLDALSLEEYRKFSPQFGEEVPGITAEASVKARDIVGGTAPRQVEQALKEARAILDRNSTTVAVQGGER
jgi:argininosuccinate lyase